MIGAFRSAAAHIQIAVLFSLSIPFAKDPQIWTPSGARGVKHHSSAKDGADVGSTSGKVYGFALFKLPQSQTAREKIREGCQVDLLSAYDVVDGHVIYEAAVRGGLGNARRCLASTTAGFHNLVPEERAGKISAKISGRRPLEKGEFDERTGQVYAGILFHKDVTPQQARNLLQAQSFAIQSESGGSFIVKHSRARLQALAQFQEIREIRAHNTTPGPTMDLSRGRIGVDALQTIDTTLNYPPNTAWMTGPNDTLTGEGISVGIYDTGIDSLVLDFRRYAILSGLNLKPPQ